MKQWSNEAKKQYSVWAGSPGDVYSQLLVRCKECLGSGGQQIWDDERFWADVNDLQVTCSTQLNLGTYPCNYRNTRTPLKVKCFSWTYVMRKHEHFNVFFLSEKTLPNITLKFKVLHLKTKQRFTWTCLLWRNFLKFICETLLITFFVDFLESISGMKYVSHNTNIKSVVLRDSEALEFSIKDVHASTCILLTSY